MMNFSRNKDTAALEVIAERSLVRMIRALLETQNKVCIGLCGGRSVAAIYQRVLEEVFLPWNQIHFFFVDERWVGLDAEESNYKLSYTTFLHQLVEEGKLPKENIHPFIAKENKEEAIKAYEEEVTAITPHLDIVFLSAGEDGHVASLFPNNAAWDAKGLFTYVPDSPKPPSERMTITKEHLLKAKAAILIIFGEQKAQALDNILNPDVEEKACPAKLIKHLPEVHVLTDIGDA